jgi:hypothetical protein
MWKLVSGAGSICHVAITVRDLVSITLMRSLPLATYTVELSGLTATPIGVEATAIVASTLLVARLMTDTLVDP